MNMKPKMEISLIHNFNHSYTDILGLTDQHILKSEFSLSEVWVLHEIEKTENCTSKAFPDILYMDMGYLGHIIRKLEKCGFIQKEQSAIDDRAYNLCIMGADRERMTQLNNASSSQIAHLLKPLPKIDCGSLVAHMTVTGTLLTEGKNVNPQGITVCTKIYPEDIGHITYPHSYIYQEEYGHSIALERYVTDSLIQFISQYQSGNNRL